MDKDINFSNLDYNEVLSFLSDNLITAKSRKKVDVFEAYANYLASLGIYPNRVNDDLLIIRSPKEIDKDDFDIRKKKMFKPDIDKDEGVDNAIKKSSKEDIENAKNDFIRDAKQEQLKEDEMFEKEFGDLSPVEVAEKLFRKDIPLGKMHEKTDPAGIRLIDGMYVYVGDPEYSFDTLKECLIFKKAAERFQNGSV